MLYVGIGLIGLAAVIQMIAGIWFLVAAFMVSVGWGLAVLFLPGAGLIILFTHWEEVKNPFLMQLTSVILMATAFVLLTREMSVARNDPAALMNAGRELLETVGVEWPTAPGDDGEAGGSAFEPVDAIPADDVRVFVGRPILDVIAVYGYPARSLTVKGQKTLFYEGWEFVSSDGVTISQQQQVEQGDEGTIVIRSWP